MERVVLGRRVNSMIRFDGAAPTPRISTTLSVAEEFGATWEGDELVTYAMEPLIWQMEHMSDEYMYDND